MDYLEIERRQLKVEKGDLYLGKFTEDMAKTMCDWVYEPPYDVYNWPDWEVVKKQEKIWSKRTRELMSSKLY